MHLMPGATLPNPKAALLFFAGTAIFDTMRHQRAAIPTTVTFADAVRDYFQDATFMPVLAPLTTAVNTALDQGCDWTREERHSSGSVEPASIVDGSVGNTCSCESTA